MPSDNGGLNQISSLVRSTLQPINPFRIVGRIVRGAGAPPGTSPGTIIHTGPRRVEEPVVQVIRYGPSGLEESRWDEIPPELPIPEPGQGVLWVNVDGLHDTALLERLGGAVGFHPLAMEDVAHVGQRPKLEEYDEHLFLLVHMLSLDEEPRRIIDEQVSVMVGPGYLFSFQEASGDVFDPVRERLRAGKGRIRHRGSDYLAYALLDALVDSYFHIVERLGEWTEELEGEVLEAPSTTSMHQVHELKRELLVLRRSIWPLREITSSFVRTESELVDPATRVYLRDVHDHSYQLMDTVEILREMASGIRDLYLSSVSNRTNQVMKVLTIMASIFIPLTFVAGVYGMNFEYMPELTVPWAYPAVLMGMLTAGLGMLWVFRRKGWI
jgi:magnesium transporter